ncbi:glycosyltransferase [Mesorhizobium sp. M7A.F.Ca.US.008.03.1.1]|uniref:glycosyltransferase n=1 Tax=Mesorhizobium sp. M7A.F.Ca.US.008.03.1.1 TaxID=2496742 RepID=UPI000FCC937E|nr:glycosyltransferase [Mesorhizobium sp. M7A.F.Ca.US.008.03.1.1]RUW61235.1 glycosyltransferase family 1 protein [Mesorhizobium sp. M7A.F.Ca.US.008.03.1.1]
MEAALGRVSASKHAGRENLLVCFSHLRWNFVHQRPQHILTLASKQQRVVYFEEPVFEDLPQPQMRTSEASPNILILTPVLPLGASAAKSDAVQRRFVQQIIASMPYSRLIAWYYTPMALRFTEFLDPDICVYDCMDELSAFKNAPPELGQMEKALLRRADLVFTGGLSLFETKRHLHHAIFPFPSSIDVKHFHTARRSGTEPADQAGIQHPRVGYFGVIDERLDVELVAQAAETMPDVQFVMLGPVVKIDPATLPTAENLHWLGSKAYCDLPDYLRHWDAGWMPFALNEATRFISPTKTPEFLAAGLPVISTAVVDVVRSYGAAGLVEIADSDDLETKLRSILSRPRETFLPQVDAYLADMSWEKTWSAMTAHIERAYQAKKVIPLRRSA